MPEHLVDANVVVTARKFNPSILSQIWLVRNNIVSEDGFVPGCLFSDVVSQVSTPEFSIVVLPEQLQFRCKPGIDLARESELITTKVGAIVGALPHTPYAAVGLNFIWHVEPKTGCDMPKLTRKIFWRAESPLFQEFDTPDGQFGAYLSRKLDDYRLKLDVKPIKLDIAPGVNSHRLQFLFNFHTPVRDNSVESIKTTLHRWSNARGTAERILKLALPGDLV